MAGTVAITRDDLWSVAYWAFHWVVEYLIDHVDDADIVSRLREIEDNNLGWVGLDDFSVEQRQKILPILQHEIVPDAERRLVPPGSGPGTCNQRHTRTGRYGVFSNNLITAELPPPLVGPALTGVGTRPRRNRNWHPL